ncbi:MAG: 5'-nucleotidase [Magnetococcales bacterium]|nr:5'-nucleotidase [Magnetococcales bacterium]MBF0115511.1 5'-nucleotidase [Magnetococcales bacterium]
MREGFDVYRQHQIDREAEALLPGVAFPVVKKLLALNNNPLASRLVDVVLLSRNAADTGLRVLRSVEHHKLDVERAVFTGGAPVHPYAAALEATLFLSTEHEDVVAALDAGVPSALLLTSTTTDNSSEQLRIAFDGDAVLFSDESERIYQQEGLEAFNRHEKDAADIPLPGGPFRPFLAALHNIQSLFPSEKSPIRTALVTARGSPAHERVVRTLRSWNIRIDEAFFLGGLPKGEFLRQFKADIFFDDQQRNCESARKHVATGHVPNEALHE